MSSIPATHVIQVTNVAPAATLEQMKDLFGFLGRIRDIKLYPSENCLIEPQSRVCYVEFYEKWSVGVAQHLTNTVFIDRALIVVPIADEGIPSESTALALTNPSSALPGLVSSGPNALINEISGVDGSLVITTVDPKLTALGLPQYPPLPANLDPVKIEEIRRTITVGNLDLSVSADNLLKYFNQIGEVKFLRMAGDGMESAKYAFVEFTDQSSVPKALQYNGITFEGRPMIINHSTSAIIKPLPKSSETAQKEIEEAMKRVREAQSLISAVIEPELPERERSRRRKSRSRSRSHARSTSASRSRRKRSRSRSKRSRSRSKRSRSRSKRSRSRAKRSRSRRRSHDRRVSRTPSRHSKHISRSRSRERKKVSPHYKKGRSRSVSRDRKKISPHYKKGRSRSRSRDRKKVSPQYKKGRSRSRSRDRNKRHRRSKSLSPSKSNSKSRSKKLRRSKERSPERERASREKEEKSEKESKDLKSKSNLSKENSQSSELYGPSLPVPKENTCSKEYSKSPVRCNKSSKSHSRSPERHIKYQSSKSQSRSPVSSKREKYKRTRSRSLSKESPSPRRNKSRSVSKHRSRSRSHKRSRSRSKGSSRRQQVSPRHRYVRRNSRSITPSRKRGSYSPRRYSASKRRKSEHALSLRKKSLSPRRKSRSPRRESKTPVRQSKSPKHKHRSPSIESSGMQNSPIRRYRSSKSPERHSSSLSPDAILLKEKEKQFLEEKEKLAALFASSDEGENIGVHSSPKVEDEAARVEMEVRNLERTFFANVNEHIQYVPTVVDYNSGYNSGDMDLGSD